MLVPMGGSGSGSGHSAGGLYDFSQWRCQRCRRRPAEMALKVLHMTYMACRCVGDPDASAESLEALLEEHMYPLGLLHRHHMFALSAQHRLCEMYGSAPGLTLPGEWCGVVCGVW